MGKIAAPPSGRSGSADVLITGATGFLGRAVVLAASRRGWSVAALTRPGGNRFSAPGVRWVEAGLETIEPADFARAGSLIHLAAAGVINGADDWRLCQEVNVRQSLACWRAAAAAGAGRFVICGSCFEYGRAGERYERIPVSAPLEPTTAYGASKAAATMLALGLAAHAELTLTVIRPFHLYGEGEAPSRFWPSLRAAAQAGQDFPMTTGAQVRDFTPVDFAAERILDEVVAPDRTPGKPLIRNLGTGQPQTLLAFAQARWAELGAKGRLLPGAVPQRAREVLRYVPEID